jgi:hypothetical protein
LGVHRISIPYNRRQFAAPQPKLLPEVSAGSKFIQITLPVMVEVCNKLMKREAATESGVVGTANQVMEALRGGAPAIGVVV